MRVLVSALESSANLHLKELLNYQKFELVGIFDSSLGTPLYSSSEFSVMGFVDVFSKLFKAYEAIKELAYLSKDVDRVLLIDSPAFNIPLAKAIKKSNPDVEIIYYILPKVWAWNRKRVAKVEAYCDRLISIFPFEDRFYNRCEYFGNPLLDSIKEFKRDKRESGKVAFLAGSRKSEINSLMPLFREVAKSIDKKAVLVSPFEDLAIYADIDGFEISHSTRETLLEADFAFVCSGTATLEASIIGVPFVLVYRAKAIDYFLAKRFVELKYIGLANIIFDFYGLDKFHNELIQDELTRENLLREYENYSAEKFLQNSIKLREILGSGSTEKLAECFI